MKVLSLVVVLLVTACATPRRAADYRTWAAYGGGVEQIRYSTLGQINKENVRQLTPAWAYDTGDAFPGSEMQCNPIVVDDLLYATTPKLRVIALDAARGTLRWSFNPFENTAVKERQRSRGLTYWAGGTERRIFVGAGHWLWALDAATGKPAPGFGSGGRIDLREGLGRDPRGMTVGLSTPGVVYGDLLIVGSLVSEALPAAPGDIRAYEALTGRLRWSFHTIPHPGEFGHETWPADAWRTSGGANSWCGMALDEKRGLLFVPTGSPAFDFYGADRAGDNLFANCLLALKASTGERVWHFQAVRHDVWDRDFPTPPALVSVRREGRIIDAVAQVTKSGHTYVFERETGKSLFPIEYRKVPPSEVEGEVLATEQPFPLQPPAFARQMLTEDVLTRRTPQAHQAALERFRKLRSAGQFTPPSAEGSVIFPGFDGGAEWGGAAFDPETRLLYVNSNEMAWVLRIVPVPPPKRLSSGSDLYAQHCAACHRPDLRGTPPEFPSLLGLSSRYAEWQVTAIVRDGSGRMPGFAHLRDPAIRAITAFITGLSGSKKELVESNEGGRSLKYTFDGYNKFLDPDGYPAVEPPWGTLNAINLDSGTIAWKIPLGEFPELASKGLRNTGTENYGGPLVTAGGLLFIGATNHDRKFRAFDKSTGKLLWEAVLPAAGNATPATYEVAGRQFVVIGAGGGKSGAPSGGAYVAFALQDQARVTAP